MNRDTSNTSSALAPIFDKDKIQAGFDITSQFINQVGTFVDNRLKEADAAQAAAKNPNLTPEQRLQAQQQADQLTAEWGPGGSYRQVLSALTAAAGGNVTGGAGQFAQAGVVNYLQQQGASYIGKLVENGTVTEGSPLHAALHAIVGCAGAAASSQSCGAGAMGAAASSLLTNLFAPPTPDMTEQEKEAKQNLISSIVAGVAAESGVGGASGAATTTTSATAAAQNNWLATEQRAQAQKEFAACTNLMCAVQTTGKWATVSSVQDAATLAGFGKGLAQAGWNDVRGLAEFLSDPVTGLNGMYQLINSKEMRDQLGQAVVDNLNSKIGQIQTALRVGGTDQALQLGESIGDLTWQVGSVVAGVGGAVKAGIGLAKVGITVGRDMLDSMALAGRSATVVDAGITWGKGIGTQGLPWENYLETTMPAGSRLPPNFKTFDFYDIETRTATSAKTLDTTLQSRVTNPQQIYSSMKSNIDAMLNFDKPYTLLGARVDPAKIVNKELQLAVPEQTNAAQWEQINRAIQYGEGQGVKVVVTTVKGN
ncbi:DUF637 domain-containing protein [Burkholderia gladioli]